MTNNTQPQLPAEVTKDIQKLAKDKMLEMDRKIKEGVSEESRHHFLTGYTEGVASGATEYATKLHHARTLLEKVVLKYSSLYEWNSGVINEIKQFLDEKK